MDPADLPKLQYTSNDTAPPHCRLECDIRPDGMEIIKRPRGLGREAPFFLALIALFSVLILGLISTLNDSPGPNEHPGNLPFAFIALAALIAISIQRIRMERTPITLSVTGDDVSLRTHTKYRRRAYNWKREHISMVAAGPPQTQWNLKTVASLRLILPGGVVIEAFPIVQIQELNWLIRQLRNFIDDAPI